MEKIDNPNKPWQNKIWLEEQYFKNKLSFVKIGKLCNRTGKTIEHFFKKFGLKARPVTARGELNFNWKGGRVYDTHGYIRLYHPANHSYRAKFIPYVLEHVIVAEKKLGRSLKHPEVVHHNDGIKDHNVPENLTVFASPKEHRTFEEQLNLFAKRILYSDLAPHLKKELQFIFEDFLSSLVKER